MLFEFAQGYSSQIASFQLFLTLIGAILHMIFAGAVAKDAGRLNQSSLKPILVSGITWAFATLLGGVFVAAIYWFLHHSKITRN